MGLDILEEKFNRFRREHPEHLPVLREIAGRVARIQTDMRTVLDGITGRLCPACKAPCCRCLPVEGWFTENDYFIYRMKYEAPYGLRVDHGIERGCAFLGPRGCVLAPDIRPFPCVKVNCDAVRRELDSCGTRARFNRLYEEMEAEQEKIWPFVKPYIDSLQTSTLQPPP